MGVTYATIPAPAASRQTVRGATSPRSVVQARAEQLGGKDAVTKAPKRGCGLNKKRFVPEPEEFVPADLSDAESDELQEVLPEAAFLFMRNVAAYNLIYHGQEAIVSAEAF